MFNWKDKKVLVTGSEGMIGRELVIQLKDLGAIVHGADYKNPEDPDLRNYYKCLALVSVTRPDYIFHLAGVKGSPKMTQEQPVSFMGPMLQFDTNMILAATEYNVSRFLYTSSIAVENPETDKYPAWAKQTAETLIEAMRIQYPETKYCIVRPSNVYGRFDNFDREHPMVITNLIKQAINKNQLELYNDGGDIRDFINAKDVARGMIKTMEEMPDYPVNLCSGEENSIKEIAEIICKYLDCSLLTNENIKGNTKRLMKPNFKFNREINIEQGIQEVIDVNSRLSS